MDQSQTDTAAVEPTDDDIVVDALEVERDIKPYDKDFILPGGQIIGLDQAVMKSIERCRKCNSFFSILTKIIYMKSSYPASEELKRKMYGCILVVGGGMKFTGIGKWLQNRVGLQIPYQYRSEQLDIVTSPKEMDPAMTAWKGAAVMSCLESAPELWINGGEWRKYGVRILREKALFMW